MKGKYATRSENRRSADLAALVDQLQSRLQKQDASYQKRIVELEQEVRRLRSDHRAEASKLADAEVHRRMEEAEEQRRKRGLSDDITYGLMYAKDKFIRNACRYLSMKTGYPVRGVLPMVMTWATDKDFFGFDRIDLMVELGVPLDGWLARRIRGGKNWEKVFVARNRKSGHAEAFTLDYVEAHREMFDVHPDYDPTWYPAIEYGGIELDGEIDEKVALLAASLGEES